MQERSINVRAEFDPEAGVWVASSEDICGLAVEAENLDKLMTKVLAALADLIELNGFEGHTPEIPVHLMAEQNLRLAGAA